MNGTIRVISKIVISILTATMYIVSLFFIFSFSLLCRYIGEREKSVENCQNVYYKDFDRDKYSDGVTSCSPEPGFFPASELISTFGDCDDSDPMVHPGSATEDIVCK